MGQTVYAESTKIHFDLGGDHRHRIRIYDFDAGKFEESTIQEIRDEYSESIQREFFAEVLRFSQGSFKKDGDEIVHKVDNVPLGAIFKIADRQKNKNGEVANVQLNTVGSITLDGKRILSINDKTNRKLYEHFVNAMNNRIDTADLF